MMEIRLQELYSVVDQIIILESRQTFRGKPKALAYPRVLSRLPGAAVTKIHYTVLDKLEGSGPWEKETYQRNQLLQLGLASSGFKPEPDDVFIVSDLDEIPKPDFVRAMKTCEGIKYPAALLSHYHYYSFDYKGDYEWDMGPRALTARQSANLTAQRLRKARPDVAKYSNTSWHCR
jgi:beta-1,4-mannosyl-glycoprotein beta-1,4-N-acetylglucosaminyltransferase